MGELAYPIDHPAHPDNAGKPFKTPPTPFTHDYMPGHPASGGLGQPVPTLAGSNEPRDGFKHLAGMTTGTLGDALHSFSLLPKDEQAARMKWNKTGIPAKPQETPAKPEEGA